jgi:ribosomal RNA assembly protein
MRERMIETVAIPDERKAVLIGKNGSTKKAIEQKTHTSITLNEVVEIEGESLDVLTACEVVKAIGRGFSPHHALLLCNEEYQLYLVSLTLTPKSRRTVKARIIGRAGRTRKKIETYTGAFVSVYGKTIGLIGTYEQIEKAKAAVTMLLEGKSHAAVYRWLAQK